MGPGDEATATFIKYALHLVKSINSLVGPGPAFSILEVIRVAQLASRDLSRNLSMNLPADYTPLTIAELFYLATMGGAQGISYQLKRYFKERLSDEIHVQSGVSKSRQTTLLETHNRNNS